MNRKIGRRIQNEVVGTVVVEVVDTVVLVLSMIIVEFSFDDNYKHWNDQHHNVDTRH